MNDPWGRVWATSGSCRCRRPTGTFQQQMGIWDGGRENLDCQFWVREKVLFLLNPERWLGTHADNLWDPKLAGIQNWGGSKDFRLRIEDHRHSEREPKHSAGALLWSPESSQGTQQPPPGPCWCRLWITRRRRRCCGLRGPRVIWLWGPWSAL